MPSLSTTERGRAWLGNFSDDDQQVAKHLLDAIEMVSDSEFRREMKRLLARARGTIYDSVVAAYSVHGLPRHFEPHYFGCVGPHSRMPPLLCPSLEHTGSEAIVQNMLRKSANALDILVDQTVDQLYGARVDRILVVTDNVASGQEVETFLAFLRANPRIRSWQSFGWTTFEVVAHSISERALARLGHQVVVHFEHLSRTFETTDWRSTELAEVRALCRKYSASKGDALGWRRAESLQLFGHTFGNGTPAILRQSRGPGGTPWVPLIPYRRDFGLAAEDMKALEDYRAPHSMLAMLSKLRGSLTGRLARVERIAEYARRRRFSRSHSSAVVALLAAIDMGNKHPVDLMKAGSMSISRLHQVARAADELGLISGYASLVLAMDAGSVGARPRTSGSSRIQLTPRGRKLLQRHSRRTRSIRALEQRPAEDALSLRPSESSASGPSQTALAQQPYYPQRLR